MSQVKDNQIQSQLWVWIWMMRIGAALSAADSTFVLYTPIQKKALQLSHSETLASFISYFAIIAYLFIVDYALFRLLIPTLKGILNTGPNKYKQALYYGTLAFCLMQTAITIGVTYQLRESSASSGLEKPKTQEIPTAKSTADTEEHKSGTAALLAAKNNAIQNAKNANPEMARLAGNGNVWAINQINAKVKSITNEYDNKIAAVEKATAKAKEAEAKAKEAEAKAKEAENKRKWEQYNLEVKQIADFLMCFAIGATIVQWISGIMIALYFVGFNEGKEESLINATPQILDVAETQRQTAPTPQPNHRVELQPSYRDLTRPRPTQPTIQPKPQPQYLKYSDLNEDEKTSFSLGIKENQIYKHFCTNITPFEIQDILEEIDLSITEVAPNDFQIEQTDMEILINALKQANTPKRRNIVPPTEKQSLKELQADYTSVAAIEKKQGDFKKFKQLHKLTVLINKIRPYTNNADAEIIKEALENVNPTLFYSSTIDVEIPQEGLLDILDEIEKLEAQFKQRFHTDLTVELDPKPRSLNGHSEKK